MDDLGEALANGGPDLKMLGGGQPANIPEMAAIWSERLSQIAADPVLCHRALSSYDAPQGNPVFLGALAKLLSETFGWDVSEENIAITCGGQTAFFLLFNLLAGEMPDGAMKKILLPVVPEYIGYSAQGVSGEIFKALKPRVVETGEREFKYEVDFDGLEITPEIAAMCVSRPTNPTGNVLSDDEVLRLSEMCREKGIPLIIDNAYGAPFPGIIFSGAKPFYDEHVILTLSLSKLGLPGMRTGMVVGPPSIIRALSSMTAITGLANPSTGQQIVLPMIESGEILRLSRDVVRPFYEEKCKRAIGLVREIFAEKFEWKIHRAEGALFLWLWFPGLPIRSTELYERLKKRGVLIIPGSHFFFGLEENDWAHRDECIRLSYAMDEAVVRGGLEVIADEMRVIEREKRS